eukprot:g3806.t2
MGPVSKHLPFVLCFLLAFTVALRPTDAVNDLSRHSIRSNSQGGRGLSSISTLYRHHHESSIETSSKTDTLETNSKELRTLLSSNGVVNVTDALLASVNNDLQVIIDRTQKGDTLNFQVTHLITPAKTMTIPYKLTFVTDPAFGITQFTCPSFGIFINTSSSSFTFTGFQVQDCDTNFDVFYVGSESCEDPDNPSRVLLDTVTFYNVTMKSNKRIIQSVPNDCSVVTLQDVNFIDNRCMAPGCCAFPLSSSLTNSEVTGNRNDGLRWFDTAIFYVPATANAKFTNIDASDNSMRIIYVEKQATTSVTDSNFVENTGRGTVDGDAATITIKGCTFTDNDMEDGYGAIWIKGTGDVTIRDSVFTGNSGEQGGCIRIDTSMPATLKNCTFIGNNAGGNGGALSIVDDGQAFVSDSIFIGNTGQYGGGVFVSTSGLFECTRCVIDGSVARSFGGAIAAYLQASFVLIDSEIINNTGSQGGAIRMEDQVNGVISKTNFRNNTSVGDGGAINQWTKTTLAITNCNFTDNSAKIGGALYLGGQGSLRISRANFTGNECVRFGAAVFVGGSNAAAIIEQTLFQANAGIQSGACRAQNKASLKFNFTRFVLNRATEDGGAISLDRQATASVANSYFGENAAANGGAIAMTTGSIMTVDDSKADENYAMGSGGVFRVSSESSLKISSTGFHFNQATRGGGGRVESNGTVETISCRFQNHTTSKDGGTLYVITDGKVILTTTNITSSESGRFGGAVFVNDATADAAGCKFAENNAQLDGGAIALLKASTANITDTAFTRNNGRSGGAIFGRDESDIEVRSSVLLDNEASEVGGGIYSSKSRLLVGDIEILLSSATGPGETITSLGGQFLYDGDSFGFV